MSLFGRNRDDRRRRNLAEDLAGESIAPAAAAAQKPAGKAERYTPAARRENHRHTTDFIPRSGIKLLLSYLAGLAIAAGLLFGFSSLFEQPNNDLGQAPLLDASQGGSLAGWFSSLLFGLSATGCVLVYSIRRHKVDDYRGRYRLWLWSAAVWTVMSIDAVANLHTPFSLAMARMTGWSMLPGAAVWSLSVWGGIVAILALRLLIEVRQCRIAVLGFTLVFSLWAAALALEYNWLPHGESPAAPFLLPIGARLLGQVTLLATIACYARHVLLDAEGLLKIRPPKPKREKPVKKQSAKNTDFETTSTNSKTARVDAPHKPGEKQSSQPATRPSYGGSSYATSSSNKPQTSGRALDDEEEDNRYSDRRSSKNRYDDEDESDNEVDDSYAGNRKLSKAERKRIRKMMRRQEREEE